MRKTMLLVAAAITLVVTSGYAENRYLITNQTEITTLLVKEKINSFCKAIIQGDITVVKRMIALGEDVNQKSLGMTPAIFAARYNRAGILKLLIDKGADIGIRSDSGFSITQFAEAANAKDAISVINTELGS